MRVALAVALGAVLLAPSARADAVDPVTIDVTAPAVTRPHVQFSVGVSVRADAGALDPAIAPLRVRVKLAGGECGGSFDGTTGQPVLDAALSPQPVPGAAYTASASGRARFGSYGVRTVCAFVEDDEQRQFATNVDAAVDVSRTCARAHTRLTSARVALRHARRAHASRARLRVLSHRVASRRRAALEACPA